MKVQRLAMDLAGDVRELDINPFVVRPRGAVALDALVVKQVSPDCPERDVDEELQARARERRAVVDDQPRRQGQRDPLLRARPADRSTSEDAHVDLAVRAIVLTAAGERHFCTGADLSVPQPHAAEARRRARPGRRRRRST